MRSLNDEGLQFSKFHFPRNKEEGLVLHSFFRNYTFYSKKAVNLRKVVYHPVSCMLNFHTLLNRVATSPLKTGKSGKVQQKSGKKRKYLEKPLRKVW